MRSGFRWPPPWPLAHGDRRLDAGSDRAAEHALDVRGPAGRGRRLYDAACRGARRAGRSRRRASATRPRSSSNKRQSRSTRSALDRYCAEAEQELRKLGRHIHRRTRAGKPDAVGVESLTAREHEVARLIVDRKTNPEIAAALFLSQKTVETHIRNMFRKLGVASRVELARAVERAEVVQRSPAS